MRLEGSSSASSAPPSSSLPATSPSTSPCWRTPGSIAIEKGYEGRRGRTWIQLTKAGRRALNDEIAALKTLIHQLENGRS